MSKIIFMGWFVNTHHDAAFSRKSGIPIFMSRHTSAFRILCSDRHRYSNIYVLTGTVILIFMFRQTPLFRYLCSDRHRYSDIYVLTDTVILIFMFWQTPLYRYLCSDRLFRYLCSDIYLISFFVNTASRKRRKWIDRKKALGSAKYYEKIRYIKWQRKKVFEICSELVMSKLPMPNSYKNLRFKSLFIVSIMFVVFRDY